MAMSAPKFLQYSSFSAEPAVTATSAPSALHSWMAKEPMPPEPPWISTRSPSLTPATIPRLDHTVVATSTTAAVSVRLSPFGMGISWPSGTATYSA